MSSYTEIIKLRNAGKTQEQIAEILGISRRSIIRYLATGKIPVYKRANKATRVDPLLDFIDIAREKLKLTPSILLEDLFIFLQEKGYQGSIRTLRRKTADLRRQLKNKEVFFQRQTHPGEVMEGDFTEMYLQLGGKRRKVYLWVISLAYSNCYLATAYYDCTFESFADGSIRGFKELGGVAKKYRLDNLRPAVSKILQGKDRQVTRRFADLQMHYKFAQDFCNPSRGNEKGNVEANNKHLKRKIQSLMDMKNLAFRDLHSFNIFLAELCRENNEKNHTKFLEEKLIALPAADFECFRSEVVSINKYSLFSLGTSAHMYSVPSNYIGLTLEVRIYPDKVKVVHDAQEVASHRRLYGPRGLVSIKVEHIIGALVKKPGAMKDWKYKEVLFERPAWKSFYERLSGAGGSDKDYLNCLKLINTYGRDLVTVAMEITMDEGRELSSKGILELLSNEFENIKQFSPIKVNLVQYDDFLRGSEDGNHAQGDPGM